MRWSMVLAALLLTARAVDAQEGPNAREKVYILADSAEWVLAYHTFPGSRTVACEVSTREQPGAIFRWFFQNQRSFTVYLMASSALIDSFVIQVDGKRPVVRKPTQEERTNNLLHIRGSQGDLLVGPGISRLRIQVFYPGREKQDLELDMAGFSALYWRAAQFDCVPPSVTDEYCQYLRKAWSGKPWPLPSVCRVPLGSSKGTRSSEKKSPPP